MNEDNKRAAIARQTAELVTAYCENLEIRPTDLPALIAYVGAVLSRELAAPAGHGDVKHLRLEQPICEIIRLEQFRAARAEVVVAARSNSNASGQFIGVVWDSGVEV